SVRGNKNTATLPGVDKKRASGHFEKKGAPFHKNNTEYKRPVSPRDRKQEHPERRHCFECGSTQHLRAQCPKINQKKNRARVNHMAGRRMEATNLSEGTPEAREDVVESLPSPDSILTARLKASKEETVQTSPLQKIQMKVGTKTFEGIVDTGAEITVVRRDIIETCPKEGEGCIKIISVFGEEELAPLVTLEMKINNERYGSIPVTCASSKKLISDMLISSTTYDALCKKIEAHAFLISDNVDSEQPVPEEQNQKGLNANNSLRFSVHLDIKNKATISRRPQPFFCVSPYLPPSAPPLFCKSRDLSFRDESMNSTAGGNYRILT
ncbi:hypothetical protein AVEN_201110-1, partial [Araneus ventricosus]